MSEDVWGRGGCEQMSTRMLLLGGHVNELEGGPLCVDTIFAFPSSTHEVTSVHQ